MRLSIAVQWRHILAIAPFCSSEIEKFDLWGVRVEFTPNDEDDWPAVVVAVDGRRMAAFTTTVRSKSKWPYGTPTAFTIPRPLLKRVKKPGQSAGEAWAEVSFDYVEREVPVKPPEGEEQDPDEAESETRHVMENMSVWGGWDDVQVRMLALAQNFPEWRKVLPPPPYRLARGVKVNAGKLGDFSAALEALSSQSTVALYRSELDHGTDKEQASPLVVQGQLTTFIGLIMPAQMEIASTLELPLWAMREGIA